MKTNRYFRDLKNDVNRKVRNFYRKHFITLKQKQIKNALNSLLYPYDEWEQIEAERLGLSYTVANAVSKITVSRSGLITFYTNRPGILIGESGRTIDGIMDKVKEYTEHENLKWSIKETKLFNF